MGRVSCKKRRGDAAASRWERVGGRKEEAKARSMNEFIGGEGKIRRGRKTAEPITRRFMGGTDKGTRSSRGVR